VRDRTSSRRAGFSLLELVVALMFMGLLMAGMATVFQGSISRFVTSSEGIASGRRNRLGLGMLQSDLNTAGMYLENLSSTRTLSISNPGFYVIPNRPVLDDAGTAVTAAANLPTRTDELYLYMDSVVSQAGILRDDIPALNALSAGGGGMPGSLIFRIELPDAAAASRIQPGQFVIMTDWLSSKLITQVTPVSGTMVQVTADLAPQSTVDGCGASAWDDYQHVSGRPVMVVTRGRTVRYRIKAKAIDPGGALVPCLVREELPYNYGATATDPATVFPAGTVDQIITEDISAFKIYLSGDKGANWAGTALAAGVNTFAGGWTQGILSDLQAQLGGVANVQNDPNWFRFVPTLVRVDLTSRTSTRRGEYLADGSTNVTAGFKDRVQSLVILPRHFGLPL
jgi:hypothetical protein